MFSLLAAGLALGLFMTPDNGKNRDTRMGDAPRARHGGMCDFRIYSDTALGCWSSRKTSKTRGGRSLQSHWDPTVRMVLMLRCSAVQCSAVQCSAVLCSAVQCNALQCSAVQCNATESPWQQLALSRHVRMVNRSQSLLHTFSAVQNVLCSAVQCSAVQLGATVQCSAILLHTSFRHKRSNRPAGVDMWTCGPIRGGQ
jgi:hypothetical protein